MATDTRGFELLLQQQQEFTRNILLQQQQWMKAILEGKTEIAQEAKPSAQQPMVPAFHKFNKEQQQWDSYIQQLEQHFVAYAVMSADKQKSFFLSWCGAEVFDLLKNLFGVVSLENQTYKELTEKLTEHFAVTHHIVAARYSFFRREMKSGQTYKEWVADLRGLARACKFVCSAEACAGNYVDDMIRDHIIVHTPHDSVRAAALQKPNAKLSDVLLIAESFETTTRTVAAIKETPNEKLMDINNVKKQPYVNKKTQKYKSCSGCFSSHKRDECKFKNAVCNKCGRKGHIAVVCMSKNENKNEQKKNIA
ncbi:uncharacterized protein LOC142234723 [Haematobia irritans]|uniref:uncharacterized protein LOC142234723 n=1 Tax=Haematobia irritans TaxID=7368 RepID=UPI003F4F5222